MQALFLLIILTLGVDHRFATWYLLLTETRKRKNKMKTLSVHDQEALTSLYAAADFMACNDIPTDSVMAAIEAIESKLR
jgi:hypothetical protein